MIEKILCADPKKKYAVCLDGENACPPEDCGGIWGYYELLEAVNNPNHEEHQEMLDWLGGQFDPGRFDLQKINAKLRGLGNLARGYADGNTPILLRNISLFATSKSR